MNFHFNSIVAKIVIWVGLLILFSLDASAVSAFFSNQIILSLFHQVLFFLGIGIKCWALVCMIRGKGLIKIPLYIWGGLAVLAGLSGLLADLTSAQSVSAQSYISRVIFAVMGFLIIDMARNAIDYAEIPKD